VALSAALPLETTIPPVVLSFNHNTHSASSYQILAKSANPRLF